MLLDGRHFAPTATQTENGQIAVAPGAAFVRTASGASVTGEKHPAPFVRQGSNPLLIRMIRAKFVVQVNKQMFRTGERIESVRLSNGHISIEQEFHRVSNSTESLISAGETLNQCETSSFDLEVRAAFARTSVGTP